MPVNALGTPDISRPTSKPSVMCRSSITSRSDSRDTFTARVAPILRARPRRESLTSVITTVATEAACDVTFAGHAIADRKAAHFLAHFDDFANVFVADMHRHRNGLLRPVVPFPDVNVGAADRGARDADHHVVVTDFGFFHACECQSRSAFEFGECFHVYTRFHSDNAERK